MTKNYLRKNVLGKNKTIILGLVFLFCFLSYYAIKFCNYAYIEKLYASGNTAFLNKITKVKEAQTLDFYLGRAQETFFGPISQVISGLLFCVICLLFFKNGNKKIFGLAIFVYLLLTKFEVLLFPPYGDAIGGPFAEAIWLSRNSFNYIELIRQPGYAWGGAQVYVFSIYPTFLAVLLKIIPLPSIFLIINHLIVFGFVAVMASLLRDIVQKVYGDETGVLVPILLISLPAFQAQIEAINMEMPCAFFIMLSAYFLVYKKINLAGVMALLATLVKGSGVLSCAAFFLIGIYLFLFDREYKHHKTILFWGIGLVLLAVGKVAFKFFLNDQHVSAGMVALAKGWPSLNHMYIFYYYMISLFIFLGFLLYQRRTGNRSWKELYTQSVMFVYGGMWFLLFFNFYAVSPRYRIVSYSFVVFCSFCAVALIIRNKMVQKCLLVFVIVAALFSSYGYFYGSLPGNYHVLLERSLEYRNDLKLNQKMAAFIEEKFSNAKIGAPFVLAQLLGLPELGYVKKDLDVMIYGFECQYGGIENYPGLANLQIANTIYVAAQVDKTKENTMYPLHAQYDKIIKEIQYGDKKAWLFMGGVGIERVFSVTRMIRMRQQMRDAFK